MPEKFDADAEVELSNVEAMQKTTAQPIEAARRARPVADMRSFPSRRVVIFPYSLLLPSAHTSFALDADQKARECGCDLSHSVNST